MAEALPRLLTLREAAARIGVPLGSLDSEIRAGRLECVRIGRSRYVTETDLGEMLDKCRKNSSRPDSICESAPVARPRGSYSIRERNTRQAAALMLAEKLKRPSRITSQQNTSPPAGRVIPLTTRSATP